MEFRSVDELGPPWSFPLLGDLRQMAAASRLLEGNPLNDPVVRPLWVYLPPAYKEMPDARFPTIYILQGMTGQLDMWRNRVPFRRTSIELYDQLFADPATPPAILVFVDCWTTLGGSQFLDSAGTGPYHSYLCDEIVPTIDSHFRTLAEPRHRGVAGKSSGGYGAMVTPLLRPDLFSGMASHAGDALFEYCYLPDIPHAVRSLRDLYQGSFERFWDDFRARPGESRPTDSALINIYCMAACYSPGPDGRPEFPFDLRTGEMVADIWERWLSWDPVRLVAARPDAARGLRAVYLDGGNRDEFFLDVGAVAFKAALERIGVGGVHLELFDGAHGGIERRYPLGIGHLARGLAAD